MKLPQLHRFWEKMIHIGASMIGMNSLIMASKRIFPNYLDMTLTSIIFLMKAFGFLKITKILLSSCPLRVVN